MFTSVQEAVPNVPDLAVVFGLAATAFLAIKDFVAHRRFGPPRAAHSREPKHG
jgi:hypothetical protein